MNHLDTISFGSSSIMLFKYPKMRRVGDTIANQIKEESEDIEVEDLLAQTKARLETTGLFADEEEGFEMDAEQLAQADYIDDEIQFDVDQVTWEQVYSKILKIQEEAQLAELNKIREAERSKAQEEFERKQQEE